MVTPLWRMLWRDLWRLRGQVVAAALVVACGISVLVGMHGAWQSLTSAQQRYYASHRFADVFAGVKRAPLAVVDALRALPGVRSVEGRILRDVTADIAGFAEPATLRLVSLPPGRAPAANAIFLLRGRMPDPVHEREVVVSSAFADANSLEVGARVSAIVNGRLRALEIVGIGMSPEFVYEVGGGMLFPDNRRFGVMWMGYDAMASAFGMDGAINDLALTLDIGTRAHTVIPTLDRMLERYGGVGAYDREDQLSHRFLTDELSEIGITATYVPSLFLAVSAFLLYTLLSRLVAMQRAQIGLLKAFGYGGARVAVHYLAFGLATVMLGTLLGIPGGLYFERWLVGLYRQYFHFPSLIAETGTRVMAIAVLAALIAALAGTVQAMRRAQRLPPAEAMRPEAPATYGEGWLDRVGLMRRLPVGIRLIVRNLVRRPLKAGLSAFGIALAVGLIVVGRFGLDGVRTMLDFQFGQVQHDDVTVVFNEERSDAARFDVMQLPGVLRAEPYRAALVWLRHGHRAERVELTGLDTAGMLREVVGYTDGARPVRADGVILSAKLAELLDVRVGDRLDVQAVQGRRRTFSLPVAATVDDLLGMQAVIQRQALSVLLGEAPAVSGLYLRVDGHVSTALFERLKRLPAVASVIVRDAMLRSITSTLDRTFAISSIVLAAFASVIVAGVVYNNIRIALSERGNELASLRVLGFTHREIVGVLMGEQLLLTLVALPLGMAVGYGLCLLLVPVFDREAFRMPLALQRATLLFATVPTLAAAFGAGLLVARRVRGLDLIAVLKSREA